MLSSPTQVQARTEGFVAPNPAPGGNLKILRPAAFRPRGVVKTLPCPEVIEERKRVAGEIHDTLAQAFAGILLQLEAANGLPGAEKASVCLAKVRELARSGLEDSRRMLLGLRPKSLEGAHLSRALSQLAGRFSRDYGIHCTFGATGRQHRLPEEIENELYRVAQEALCNVRKHSNAGSVGILLGYDSGSVVLAIKDNGQGFSINQRQAGAQGFGLPTISERANRLGGKVDINTGPGAGTEIRMSVPLSGKASNRRNNRLKQKADGRADQIADSRLSLSL